MTTLAPLPVPQISINGTAAEDLIRQACDAGIAINRAIDELGRAMPHGRDYQAKGNLMEAQNAWRERIKLLAQIRKDLEGYAQAIDKVTAR
jgi:hypothetical protein